MYTYGVLKASPKKLSITASKAGTFAHITATNGTSYDISIYLGSNTDPVYFSLFTSTDRASIAYLLPLLESRFRLQWFDSFNRLKNSDINGSLDFIRNIFLYDHITQPYNLTVSTPNTYPFNDKLEDDLSAWDNDRLTQRYGLAATALRAMFNLYKTRYIVVFGNLGASNKMFGINFNQNINSHGVLTGSYGDGAVFFWDPMTNMIDGMFIMKSQQYNQYLIKLVNSSINY